MDEWYSFFGKDQLFFHEFDSSVELNFPESTNSPADPDLSLFDPCFVNTVSHWISLCSGNHLQVSTSGYEALESCLEVFLSHVLEACNEESIRRTHQQDKRVLVPAVVGGAIPKCPYLQFISNDGLMKPKSLDFVVCFISFCLERAFQPLDETSRTEGHQESRSSLSFCYNGR